MAYPHLIIGGPVLTTARRLVTPFYLWMPRFYLTVPGLTLQPGGTFGPVGQAPVKSEGNNTLGQSWPTCPALLSQRSRKPLDSLGSLDSHIPATAEVAAADARFVRPAHGDLMAAERWRRFLGWSQLICGLLGVAVLPWAADRMPTVTDPNSYMAGGFIYVGLTALAGIGLLRGSSWSISLSACMQIPQVFWFANPSFRFRFICGPMLLIQLIPGNLSFGTGFEVTAGLGRNAGPEQQLYALNLFPILALRGCGGREDWQTRLPPKPPLGSVVAASPLAVPPNKRMQLTAPQSKEH